MGVDEEDAKRLVVDEGKEGEEEREEEVEEEEEEVNIYF